mmetsp:Transcript_9537/g.31144  ORF Transcript_9537/g.31144 Transcript_9537/m.31144 type:complete len:350 (+) Transcript_9537:86-1135(+)|eukprot:CAMPEP_0118920092 /NCGR_PEP_ID=MMETSP1166-20130328/18865_1 /TAXON_ID=1104430 /ORGANISM="Chrysoreinhardia sp, Strain CCMP3193" /LENGTH=349 /DNA_ID=CAMNT_0006860629 /DNA_START=97 /DNA_END=1146 /DNA_ORIENTATION=+
MAARNGTEVDLKVVAEMCRSSILVRQAIERGFSSDTDRRVEYFKGDKLVSNLLGDDPGSSSSTTSTSSRKKKRSRAYEAGNVEEATSVATSLLRAGYFHKAQRVGKGVLECAESQRWEGGGYYVWDFEGKKGLSHFLTGLLIVSMLTITAFPIWPHFLKVYLWYCSVTLLIVMVVFLIIRAVLFLDCWICGYDFWIFPNLFDETLSVIDSFKPAYSFDPGAPGQRYYRAAVVLALSSFAVYCYNQPTDFDTFVAAQKEFVADLYEGKLIADTSQQAKDDIDKLKRPSFDELAQEDASDTYSSKETPRQENLQPQDLRGAAAAGDNEDFDDDEDAADDMIDSLLDLDDED